MVMTFCDVLLHINNIIKIKERIIIGKNFNVLNLIAVQLNNIQFRSTWLLYLKRIGEFRNVISSVCFYIEIYVYKMLYSSMNTPLQICNLYSTVRIDFKCKVYKKLNVESV